MLLLFSFLPSLNFFDDEINILIISIFVIYLFFISIVFKNIWEWFMKEKDYFIVKFLKSLDVKKDKQKILDSYESLWLRNISAEREKEYTEIFCDEITKFLNIKDYKSAVRITRFYLNDIDKRVNLWVMANLFFSNVLDWMRIEKEIIDVEENWNKLEMYDTKNGFRYFRSDVLTDIFEFLVKKDGWNFYGIYDVAKRENDLDILKHFFHLLFEIIIDEKNNDKVQIILKHFPSKWKITRENFIQKHQEIIIKKFLEILEHRIIKNIPEKKYDLVLNELVSELFPEVEHDVFINSIYLFYFRSKEFISRDERLGITIAIDGDIDDMIKDTIELFKLLNPNFYGNKNKLEKLKADFKEMKVSNETEEKRKDDALKIINMYLETFK